MLIEINTPNKLEYQFQPVYGDIFEFEVSAPKDAHLILSSKASEDGPTYEVFIGGWNNSKSVIRKNRKKPDVVEIHTPGILNAGEFRGFWIHWHDNVITVGHKGNTAAFLYYNAGQLFPVNYVGICTGWGATGTWLLDAKGPESKHKQGELVPLNSRANEQNFKMLAGFEKQMMLQLMDDLKIDASSSMTQTYFNNFINTDLLEWQKTVVDRKLSLEERRLEFAQYNAIEDRKLAMEERRLIFEQNKLKLELEERQLEYEQNIQKLALEERRLEREQTKAIEEQKLEVRRLECEQNNQKLALEERRLECEQFRALEELKLETRRLECENLKQKLAEVEGRLQCVQKKANDIGLSIFGIRIPIPIIKSVN